MSFVYVSPEGNPEIWREKPDGYFTEDEWSALHPVLSPEPPSLADRQATLLMDLASRTRERILAGFTHTVAGQSYHFGYDEEDQANFAKANSAALYATIRNDTSFRQTWRGWQGDYPTVFHFTAPEYFALSQTGGEHQLWYQQRYWEKEAMIKAASSAEELESITV